MMGGGTDAGLAGARRLQRWALPVILLIAVFLRVYHLADLPPGLFRDEAEKGYNAWLLWQDGRDANGNPWPLFIKVFGVTTSAIYQYAALPFVAVLGLNEWSARLPAACVGVLTVWVAWRLGRRLGGWQVGAISAGLLAISPWHVPLSRWGQQGVFLPLLIGLGVLGVTLLLGRKEGEDSTATSRDKALGVVLAGGGFGLAMYSYDPARLLVPLLLLVVLGLWWRAWFQQWKWMLAGVAMLMLCSSPVIWLLLNQGDAAQARFQYLSIVQPGQSVGQVGRQFVLNYLSHFSPDFLLVSGDKELRHSAGVGMLNVAEFLAAVAGVVFAVRSRCRWVWLLILWIVLSPVPASLTRVGVPHALRCQLVLPAWQLLAAFGMVGCAEVCASTRKFWQVAMLITLCGFLPFVSSYFGKYKYRSAFSWQHGVKDALAYLNNANTRKAAVYLHNVVGAEYLIPFYLKMDRMQYRAFLNGNSRYHLMAFQQPGRLAPPSGGTPAAWLTPPGYDWPRGCVAIPMVLPGGEELMRAQLPWYGPATLIIMNPALTEQVKESVE